MAPLEDRVVLTSIVEIEPNNTFGTAHGVVVNTGNVLSTAPDNWLNLSGSIGAADVDYYKFVLGQRSGVFFDVDSRETGLSATLNSMLTLYNSVGVQLDSNDNGYDFQTGFPAPTSVASAATADSAVYRDLNPGTYYVRLSSVAASVGNYLLSMLADTSYSASVPAFSSKPGAGDTLFLDFNGHISAGDAWDAGGYTIDPFDHNGNGAEYTPGEKLAIKNTWRMVAEDYSPFNINVTTSYFGAFADGVAFRQVIGNSDGSEVGYGPGILGVAFLGSYAAGGASNQLAFTFADNFSSTGYGGGMSGRIMANPVEMGNTSSHEFGHALTLRHFDDPGQQVAIMFTPDQGLSRETWFKGVNANGVYQDDMAIIASPANTIGYRPDDHGDIPAFATALGGFGVLKASGIIGNINLPDRDWFRFTQSAAGLTRIQVDVQEYVNDLDTELRLYNAGGVLIATSDPLASFDSSLALFLAAGTYYVEVRSDGGPGEAGQYDLSVTRPAALAITDRTVIEPDVGIIFASFTIGLEGPSAVPVSVNYWTGNFTAVAPGDYTAVPVTNVVFAPGETSRTIFVPIKGDTLDEWNEVFTVSLGGAVGAPIVDPVGIGTIIDNDPTPKLQISDAFVTEGDFGTTTATFLVTLSAPSGRTVTVNYSTANGTAVAPWDYTAVPLTGLTFLPGQTVKLVSVNVRGETLFEADETFFVNLSGAVNAVISDGSGKGTIDNDDFIIIWPALEVSAPTTDSAVLADGDGSARHFGKSPAQPGALPEISPAILDVLAAREGGLEWLASIRPGRVRAKFKLRV